mgnify:CR=1 FL=1
MRLVTTEVGNVTMWAYPKALAYDGKLYVIYSQGKEDCALSVISIDVLRAQNKKHIFETADRKQEGSCSAVFCMCNAFRTEHPAYYLGNSIISGKQACILRLFAPRL